MTQIADLITCRLEGVGTTHWAHPGATTTVCGRVFTEVVEGSPRGPGCNACRSLVIYGSIGAVQRGYRRAAARR